MAASTTSTIPSETIDKDYPFENLVMEGGGNKGLAYVGAIRVLEEAGIMKNIKRFCGASAGSMVAALLAVGYTADELKGFLEADLKKIMFDNNWGYFSLIPNLLSGYGWNPGKKLLKWFGEKMKERTGKADITFGEIYKQRGIELCIIVTNLNQMLIEYCHPKTTPEMPINLAVRMSSSLPGVFQGVWHRSDRSTTKGDEEDIYIDGGLVCNYPIHAFDGWFLSMKNEDSFFRKIPHLAKMSQMYSKDTGRFTGKNMKTIGLMLYSNSDVELMKEELKERLGDDKPAKPKKSKLYKERKHIAKERKEAEKNYKKIVAPMLKFMDEVASMNYDEDNVVDIKEMREIFEKSTKFTKEDQRILFGDMTVEEAFNELDVNNDNEVSFKELMTFVERKGINLRQNYLGLCRKKVKSFSDFLFCIEECLCVNIKRLYVDPSDVDRTIGIDTSYIETTDFELDQYDKEFLIESGEKAALAFLRYYNKQDNPAK